MGQSKRPLRADAVRNRARVMEAAYELFAQGGTAVALDTTAEHAGVGPGTVHRHFPTKQALVEAVIANRVGLIIEEGQCLLADDPGDALFASIRACPAWVSTHRALVEVLMSRRSR